MFMNTVLCSSLEHSLKLLKFSVLCVHYFTFIFTTFLKMTLMSVLMYSPNQSLKKVSQKLVSQWNALLSDFVSQEEHSQTLLLFSFNSSKGFQLNKCKCLLNYWWHNVVSIFIIYGIYSIAWKQILYFVRLLNALYSHVICWLARRFLTVGLETSNQLIFWWQKTV